MANNRMWLLHKPSGKAVMLGKRMADGWYNEKDITDSVRTLFANVFAAGDGLDDWTLAMEDCSQSNNAFGDWEYTNDIDGSIRILKVGKHGN